jgi:hypothetical protein
MWADSCSRATTASQPLPPAHHDDAGGGATPSLALCLVRSVLLHARPGKTPGCYSTHRA